MKEVMDAPTVCPNCNSKGCEDCLGLGFIAPVSQKQVNRVRDLFYEKLAVQHPDHPWLKRKGTTE